MSKNKSIDREKKLREQLLNYEETEYKKFTSSLIPGANNILGVRIPLLRNIAKEIAKDSPLEFLNNTTEIYFEETMIKGLIIGNMKAEIDVILEQASLFIPKITNWSLCDSFCAELKIVKKHKEKVWEYLEQYYKSEEPYEIRFAIVLMLFHFVDKDYIEKIIDVCDSIKNENYYVKMAVAWCLSVCFVKFPEITYAYLKNNNLDNETQNKTIQKIRESLRVEESVKEDLKGLKRK